MEASQSDSFLCSVYAAETCAMVETLAMRGRSNNENYEKSPEAKFLAAVNHKQKKKK